MSDMEDFVDVRITQHGREIVSGRYKVPVTIGRMADNSIRLGVAPYDNTISRIHAQIDRVADRLCLLDRSRNGTRYRGKLLTAGNIVELEDEDSFEIRGYVVKVARARRDPTVPVLFEVHILLGDRMHGKPLSIGELMVLCIKTGAGRLRFDHVPMEVDWRTIIVRHRLDGEALLAAVMARRGIGHLMSRRQGAHGITVNLHPVTEEDRELRPRDVIHIGKVCIELHSPGEKSLKCPNPACGLLNPYAPNENCRFCSFRLVEGVSRVASLRGSQE